jgi:hypothetical protein
LDCNPLDIGRRPKMIINSKHQSILYGMIQSCFTSSGGTNVI